MYTMVPYRRHLNRELTAPFVADRFFRSFFDMNDMVGTAGFRVDVREDDNAYQLEAELPGVPKDKINLSVEDNVLTISADLNDEKKEEGKGYVYSERRSGHVERSFNLEGINAEGIAADYKHGVLLVTLPKIAPEPKAEPKKIAIAGEE
ncbi:MAG TPA: Hsp20/alpha crystallin family protein [Candidatus Limiplasma sp.]|nr:Hsp20/alpha crystallin family protein [Candidatus Limiplasma sp.]